MHLQHRFTAYKGDKGRWRYIYLTFISRWLLRSPAQLHFILTTLPSAF